LETTARYARVATGLISAVESPLDRLSERKRTKKQDKDAPPEK
jgi:integrase/recombinase XerD